MNVSVHVSNLEFSYGSRNVINKMNQRFNAGRITGVLGPNGCGKSTLIKNILGYLQASNGRVEFINDADALPLKTRRSRTVSLVPQRPGAMGSETVFDTVQMGRLPYVENRWAGYSSADRKKTEEVMRRLDLTDFQDRPVGDLSGGEQQKVMLARCLVQDTPVMLLDEATANLDMQHKVDIMLKIRERVQNSGTTVIAVMHDLNLAAQFCDSILFMKNGHSRYYGTPREVITSEAINEIYGIHLTVYIDNAGVPFVLPGRDLMIPCSEPERKILNVL